MKKIKILAISMALASTVGMFGSYASGLAYYNRRTGSGLWWNYLYADFVSGANLCSQDDPKERKIKYVSLEIKDGSCHAKGSSSKATSKNKNQWISRDISCGNDLTTRGKYIITWYV